MKFVELKSDPENLDLKYDYSCRAKLVSVDDLLLQSQTENITPSTSEGAKDLENPEFLNVLSGIGRENEQEADDGNLLEFGGFIDSDLDQNKINRKILDLNGITFDDVPKNLF